MSLRSFEICKKKESIKTLAVAPLFNGFFTVEI